MYRNYFSYLLLLLLMLSSKAMGQHNDFEVYFHQGSSAIDTEHMDNARVLDRLGAILLSSTFIDGSGYLDIRSSASVEGGNIYNYNLAHQRLIAMRDFLVTKYPDIESYRIRMCGVIDTWQGLRELVGSDMAIPNRDIVLDILNRDLSTADRQRLLKAIDSGRSWQYIHTHYMPYLRRAAISADGTAPIIIENETPIVVVRETLEPFDTVTVTQKEPIAPLDATSTTKPLFALKTNLLMDMISAVNIEVEVPIGDRWSLAGEWIFPWWLWEDKQNCFQLLSGNLEGRYWFGNRLEKDVMTGWFAGLYAGAGLYDLEWDKTGYQGEFYIAAGISGGYAHTINRLGNLRMEYSLGVGYLSTDYKRYEAEYCTYDHWHLNPKSSGTYRWFGPTRAKASLIWMLNRKVKGGER